MADKRRLQGDIERTLKRVHEGRSAFQEILDKFESASNHTQKEKFEADLKKEIKKLQRLRDQIKTWITSNEIKDKRLLHDARKDIETDMERFKVIEKETKTKAYSKEGLVTEAKRDPLQKEKDDMDEWVKLCISTFQERKEKTEFDIESFNSSKKKRNDREKIQGLQVKLDIQQLHVDKLETVLRLLDNELLDIDNVKGIKEVIEYYIEQSEDSIEMDEESKTYYDELNLEELCDTAGSSANNPLAVPNAVPGGVPYLSENDSVPKPQPEPTEITTSRSSSPLQSVSSNVSGADSLSVSSSGLGGSTSNQENANSSSNSTVLSRERRKSEEKNSSVNNTIHSSKSHGKSAGNTPLPYSGPINAPLSQLTTSGPVLNMSTVVAEIDNSSSVSVSQQSVIPHPSINSSSNGINLIPNVSSTATSTPVSSSNYSASVTKQGIESIIDLKPKTPTPQVKPLQPIGSQPNERDSPSMWQQTQPLQNLSSSIQASVRLIQNATTQPSFSQSAPQQQSLFAKTPSVGIEVSQQNSMNISHGPPDLKAIAARQANSLLSQKSMNPPPPFMPLPPQTQNSQSIIAPEPQAIILDSKDAIAPFRNRQLHHQQEKIMPQIQALESGFKKLPHPGDTDRARMILYKVLPHSACPPYYPREPPKNADTEEYYMKLDPKTLFFIFYYFEGTKAQHLAAKALKRMSWRFHTKYMMWFQRHEEPKKITDEYESGTYIYYDIESMSQRKKENFMFEYAFLEDKDI